MTEQQRVVTDLNLGNELRYLLKQVSNSRERAMPDLGSSRVLCYTSK